MFIRLVADGMLFLTGNLFLPLGIERRFILVEPNVFQFRKLAFGNNL